MASTVATVSAVTPSWIDRWSDAQAASRHSCGAPAHVGATRSVLVAAASSEQIRGLEHRLGMKLPPSYREFLAVSNGAYASSSLQNLEFRHLAPGVGADPPLELYPAQRVAWARSSDPFYAGQFLEWFEPKPDGSATPFDRRDEADPYGQGDDIETLRHGHVMYALHIGGEGDTDHVFLDPLVVDPSGEWEVLLIGNGFHTERHASFRAFLETYTEASLRNERENSWKPEGMPSVFEVATTPNIAAMGAQLEKVVSDDSVEPAKRSAAVFLFEILDDRDGGERVQRWLRTLMHNLDFSQVRVLERLLATDGLLEGWPTAGEVYEMHRPGDERALEFASRPAVQRLSAEIGAGAIRNEVSRRALPPFDPPAAAAIAEWAWERRLTTPLTVQQLLRMSPMQFTVDEMMLASTQLRLSVDQTARALAIDGHGESAIELLASNLNDADDWLNCYALAEFDHPEVWARLDELAQVEAGDFAHPLAWPALLAAAGTSSPLLAPRAHRLATDGPPALARIGLVALERQRTEAAADALLDLYERGNLAALRALGRRRDSRITATATSLLDSDDPTQQLTGARCLRDIGDPSTATALLAALPRGGPSDLVLTIGRALAALAPPGAAEALGTASGTQSGQAAELLQHWSELLRQT